MKKLLLFLILLFPLIVKADVKVVSHLIDSEIEIAGGLNVKELIIVEGDTDVFQRTLNYYSFGSSAWDGKEVNFDNGSIYNGQSISIAGISAYEFDDKASFGEFDKGITEYFSEFDIKNPSNNTYTFVDNKNGTGRLKIFYPVKNKRIAFYINYVVTNVVVKHNDIKEINYTFKNLYNDAKDTLLRVIIPYPTNDDIYHVWVHGNRSGSVQELVNSTEQKLGIVASFPKVSDSINFRMTLANEQVGIDMYLNKSNVDALDEVVNLEKNRSDNSDRSNKITNAMKYILIGLGLVYVIFSFAFLKININSLFIIYLLFGLVIMVFNYLFSFNFWYLYLIILFPCIFKLVKKYHCKN